MLAQHAARNLKVTLLLEKGHDAVEAFEREFEELGGLRKKALRQLGRSTHRDNIQSDGLARVSHVTDATDWRIEYPFVVINPDSEGEVAGLVRDCIELGLTIVPRGGGTGVAVKAYLDTHPGGAMLAGLEHLDERYLKAVGYATKARRSGRPKMVLIGDIVGEDNNAVALAASHVLRIANARSGEGFIAVSAESRKTFWLDRARTAAIAKHTNAFKINEDVIIPLGRLGDYSTGSSVSTSSYPSPTSSSCSKRSRPASMALCRFTRTRRICPRTNCSVTGVN